MKWHRENAPPLRHHAHCVGVSVGAGHGHCLADQGESPIQVLPSSCATPPSCCPFKAPSSAEGHTASGRRAHHWQHRRRQTRICPPRLAVWHRRCQRRLLPVLFVRLVGNTPIHAPIHQSLVGVRWSTCSSTEMSLFFLPQLLHTWVWVAGLRRVRWSSAAQKWRVPQRYL